MASAGSAVRSEDVQEWGQQLDEVARRIGSRFPRSETRDRVRAYLVGLLVPDPEYASGPDVMKVLGAAVDRVNKELSVIEKVRRFILADEPFSVENEMLTPSLKIRRHVIRKAYGERLDALYKK